MESLLGSPVAVGPVSCWLWPRWTPTLRGSSEVGVLRLALLAMHALATLYAELFMRLLHQSGMELGLPWHGIMSTWTCAATTLWRWLRSAWFTCIRLWTPLATATHYALDTMCSPTQRDVNHRVCCWAYWRRPLSRSTS